MPPTDTHRPSGPPPDPSADWHRQVAARCNNAAWDLAERDRTAEDDRQMVRLAETAAFHWAEIGTAVQRGHAALLLAIVYGQLGQDGPAACCLAEASPHMQADWEQALLAVAEAWVAHAQAPASYPSKRAAATSLVDQIATDGDRKIVAASFDRLP